MLDFWERAANKPIVPPGPLIIFNSRTCLFSTLLCTPAASHGAHWQSYSPMAAIHIEQVPCHISLSLSKQEMLWETSFLRGFPFGNNVIRHFFTGFISNWKYHEEAGFSLYFLFAQGCSHAEGAIESKDRQGPGVLTEAGEKVRRNCFSLLCPPPPHIYIYLVAPAAATTTSLVDNALAWPGGPCRGIARRTPQVE